VDELHHGSLANLPSPHCSDPHSFGFLILINVFTGLHRIWFHWPVARCCSLASCAQCSGTDLPRTAMRIAEASGVSGSG